MNISKALIALRPNATWEMEGEDYNNLVWKDESQTKPTLEEVTAKVAELDAEYASTQYQRNRASAYKSIEEQLDMQYWDRVNGTDTWKQHIDAVKTAHPKPTE
jgi:uncharacterized membrane-anchored protein